MEKVKVFVKANWKYILTALIAFTIGTAAGPSTGELEEAVTECDKFENLYAQTSNDLANVEKENTSLNDEIDELKAKVDEAAPWFKLSEDEQKKVEADVKEVEEKAKKEAEEKAKKEAEEKAKKEAEEKAKKEAEEKAKKEAEEKAKKEAEEKAKKEAEEKAKQEAEEAKKAAETVSQQNAIRAAENYLNFTAFSKSGLIDQLEFEGYSSADATYAVESIEDRVDWDSQAVAAAQNYLEFTAFSRSGLIDQLKFDGFTTEQATYAADNVGL